MIPEGVPGYMASHELAVLNALASTLPKKGVWVEVGTWAGRSLLATGKGLDPSCHIIAVDDLRGVENPPDETVRQYLSDVISFLSQRLELADHLELQSAQAANNFGKASVDAVFIDGSHDYESVLLDLKAWKPKLAKGGFLVGHDHYLPDVRRAVNEVLPGAYSIHATSLWKWDNR